MQTGVDPAFVQSRLTVELQQWLNANQDVIPAEERNQIGRQHIRLTATGGGVDRLRESYSAGLRLLLTLSGLVLIRMALGASRRNVLALVLRAALVQVGFGLAIGVPVALVGSRVLASQLWGVKSYDPMILAIAAFALAVCAIFAASLPARRATRLDPIVALRYE